MFQDKEMVNDYLAGLNASNWICQYHRTNE